MIQKIRMSMMTMKLRRRRRKQTTTGEKSTFESKEKKIREAGRILTKTQRKEEKKAKRSTLSLCLFTPETPDWGNSSALLLLRGSGLRECFLIRASIPLVWWRWDIVKMMCRLSELDILVHHFNSACALNSIQGGCAVKRKALQLTAGKGAGEKWRKWTRGNSDSKNVF